MLWTTILLIFTFCNSLIKFNSKDTLKSKISYWALKIRNVIRL